MGEKPQVACEVKHSDEAIGGGGPSTDPLQLIYVLIHARRNAGSCYSHLQMDTKRSASVLSEATESRSNLPLYSLVHSL